MEALLLELLQEREVLEQSVFDHPPKTWEEFQKRLGEHMALTTVINKITGKIEESEQ